MRIVKLVLIVLCWSAVICPVAGAAEPLRFTTSIKPPFSTVDKTGFFDVLISELSQRIHTTIEIVRVPPARALVMVNEGLSDGELPRIAGLQEEFENLILVEEKLLDYTFVGFTWKEMEVDKWEDLAGKNVGYLIGWRIFEHNVPETEQVYKLRMPKLLFEMLNAKRIDVALYERYAGWEILKGGAPLPEIHELPKPLAVKGMYLYMNKKNAHLVPAVTRALREMKEDGTYQRIFDATLHVEEDIYFP
ncbi:ABC transporter substrate-binding protein [Pseudodesulfovibrio sediminis]|uniref:ABC transporter substrate-binding protein n=2 Tax=Pseudodesulfovibrio sediminis TaxID=2810563 RepID=A0ABN6EX63_9BACT|nr:ABC transporter substrate-binding protein [Pseudodesulfovibrio sediminis]